MKLFLLLHEHISIAKFSFRSFLDTYLFFPKPIICAVRGHLLEFGLSLVVAADYTYTSSTKVRRLYIL